MLRASQLAQRKVVPGIARKMRDLLRKSAKLVVDRANVASRLGRRSLKRQADGAWPIPIVGTQPAVTIELEANVTVWGQAIQEVLAELDLEANMILTEGLDEIAASSYTSTTRLVGGYIPTSLDDVLVAERAQLAARIRGISETTRRAFFDVVSTSIQDHDTAIDTARKLVAKIDGTSTARALTIARTEAQNYWAGVSGRLMMDSESVTHVSVVGCQDREDSSPHYRGESTCNITDVPAVELPALLAIGWHPNHQGTLVPSRFRE
jgi:hypothetical protein